MTSYRGLQAVVEAALQGRSPESHHRDNFIRALGDFGDHFKNFLVFKGPIPEHKEELLSKKVRGDLEDHIVDLALQLSREFHLNEFECVQLLMAAQREWDLVGRDAVQVFHLAAGLWFTERRALITSVQSLFRHAGVLEKNHDPNFVEQLRQYLIGLMCQGFRRRLILLIQEINREEPAGSGGPDTEPNVLDEDGFLVQRRDVAQNERLRISQCLVFSCLIVRLNAQEVKDLYSLLKDCSADANITQDTVKLQVAYTIMFSLVISLILDALGGGQEVLSNDSSFQHEFQQMIMDDDNSTPIEGFIGVIRLVWGQYS